METKKIKLTDGQKKEFAHSMYLTLRLRGKDKKEILGWRAGIRAALFIFDITDEQRREFDHIDFESADEKTFVAMLIK
jgi:hypothetical protein